MANAHVLLLLALLAAGAAAITINVNGVNQTAVEIVEPFWDGVRGVTLDASATTGGVPPLRFEWTIAASAIGSGVVPGVVVELSELGGNLNFVAAVPGVWVLGLRIVDAQDTEATASVDLLLLSMPEEHPRLHVTPTGLAGLPATVANPAWNNLLAAASEGAVEALALAHLVRPGDFPQYCNTSVDAVGTLATDAPLDDVVRLARVMDWCARDDDLAPALLAWAAAQPPPPSAIQWAGEDLAAVSVLGIVAVATADPDLLSAFRERFEGRVVPLLAALGEGGAWPGSPDDEAVGVLPLLAVVHAWETATGELIGDLAEDWLQDRGELALMRSWAGAVESPDGRYSFHAYPPFGQAAAADDYIVANKLRHIALLSAMPGDGTVGLQLQAYVSSGPTARSHPDFAAGEFLWSDASRTAQVPSRVASQIEDAGLVFLRSDWPDGASDTSSSAIHLALSVGPLLGTSQHLDAGHFVLARGPTQVLADPGAGFAQSRHHNTIFFPADGAGQRSLAAPSLADYEAAPETYLRGQVSRVASNAAVAIARVDVSPAYDSARLTQFMRQVVFVRGGDEVVAVVDRVRATESIAVAFQVTGAPVVRGRTATLASSGARITSLDPDAGFAAENDGGAHRVEVAVDDPTEVMLLTIVDATGDTVATELEVVEGSIRGALLVGSERNRALVMSSSVAGTDMLGTFGYRYTPVRNRTTHMAVELEGSARFSISASRAEDTGTVTITFTPCVGDACGQIQATPDGIAVFETVEVVPDANDPTQSDVAGATPSLSPDGSDNGGDGDNSQGGPDDDDDDDDNDDDNNNKSGGQDLLIPIFAGSVGAALVFVAIAFVVHRRKKRSKDKHGFVEMISG